MDESKNESCPLCVKEFDENDNIIECPNCGKVYHKECWENNDGCSTIECSQNRKNGTSSAKTDMYICQNCGASLIEGEQFCHNCGTKRSCNNSNFICSACGTELNEGIEFCPKCGTKFGVGPNINTISAINSYNKNIQNKKSKAKLLPIIITLIVLVIGFGGYFANRFYTVQNEIKSIQKLITDKNYSEAYQKCNTFLGKNKNTKIEKLLIEVKAEMKKEYKDNATLFSIGAISAGSNLEGIGNQIKDDWHSYIFDNWSIYYSIDNAISCALEEKADDVTKAKDERAKLDNLYCILRVVPYDDTELNEVRNSVKDLYNAYSDFYELSINPSGSYNSFTTTFGTEENEFVKKYNELKSLL